MHPFMTKKPRFYLILFIFLTLIASFSISASKSFSSASLIDLFILFLIALPTFLALDAYLIRYSISNRIVIEEHWLTKRRRGWDLDRVISCNPYAPHESNELQYHYRFHDGNVLKISSNPSTSYLIEILNDAVYKNNIDRLDL